VSVHDKGQWVTDFDLLYHLAKVKCVRDDIPCSHQANASAPLIGNPKFTMVDTWSEILDKPHNPAVVRSKNNWIGRLATSAVSAQMGNPTIVCRHSLCWECVKAGWLELWEEEFRREYHKGATGKEDNPENITLPHTHSSPSHQEERKIENLDKEARSGDADRLFEDMPHTIPIC